MPKFNYSGKFLSPGSTLVTDAFVDRSKRVSELYENCSPCVNHSSVESIGLGHRYARYATFGSSHSIDLD